MPMSEAAQRKWMAGVMRRNGKLPEPPSKLSSPLFFLKSQEGNKTFAIDLGTRSNPSIFYDSKAAQNCSLVPADPPADPIFAGGMSLDFRAGNGTREDECVRSKIYPVVGASLLSFAADELICLKGHDDPTCVNKPIPGTAPEWTLLIVAVAVTIGCVVSRVVLKRRQPRDDEVMHTIVGRSGPGIFDVIRTNGLRNPLLREGGSSLLEESKEDSQGPQRRLSG